MTRREALLALLCAVCLVVLPGCSDSTGGPVSHHERALVFSVDEESQTAEVRILELPDKVVLPQGQTDADVRGTASFSDWGNDALPEVGDDVILTWIGDPSEELSFPIKVYDWEPTVSFYESLGDAHEVRLPASMLRFFSQTAEELVADFEGIRSSRSRRARTARTWCSRSRSCNSRTTGRTWSRASMGA